MTTVLLLIAVLVALIVVHELGHFIVAKLSGMRVDEFGVGYPPRAWATKRGETEYSLNWLPFGGFVRIYGEDEGEATDPRAFSRRPRLHQAATLVAGIAMNLAFAYVLITLILAIGTPRALAPEDVPNARDVGVAIVGILPGSPAANAGLKEGDLIITVSSGDATFASGNADQFTAFVAEGKRGEPLMFVIDRNGSEETISITPTAGVIKESPDRLGVGVAVATIGTVPVPFWKAPWEGLVLTWELTKQTAVGLVKFLGGILSLNADLSQVTGPVGLAGAVGNAYAHGFTQLLSITALISINLALINLLPIPALDGGRLLFVLIEAILRRPISPVMARRVNTVGFMALLLLMVVITANDVFRLFT